MTDEPPNRPASVDGGLHSCWFCGKGVSPRAFFCHQCGSVQPPADVDPFTRLNLTPRFDVQPAELDRQATGFRRILDPGRFTTKGPRERGMAEAQRTLIEASAAWLRDPIRRARLLLELAGREPLPSDPSNNWQLDLAVAGDAPAVDKLANRLTGELETDLRALSAAFRTQDLDRAAELTARIEGLRAVSELARLRRAELLQKSSGF